VPGVRSAIVAVLVGLGAGLYFALWFHWPTFLAVAVGAFMAIVLLMIASSLGEDPAAADAAWREAAPDLVTRPGSPESARDSTSKPP
jgi:predicted MFS family arabinose efflux permease